MNICLKFLHYSTYELLAYHFDDIFQKIKISGKLIFEVKRKKSECFRKSIVVSFEDNFVDGIK